jgi:hypothetical protein
MAQRRPINLQFATDAQLRSINSIDQSKSRRVIRKRDEKGILLKEDFVECTFALMEEVEELISQNVVDFDPIVTKKELADEIKTQLQPTLRLVKETQIELQEAQAKIMEALSVIQHTPQSKENFVTQIDLQNLKKELSTELKNELVDEVRSVKTTQIELQEAQVKIMEGLSVIEQTSQSKEKFATQIDLQNLKKELSTDFKNELVTEMRKKYEEKAKLSKTSVNITQQLLTFSINLKKEIAEQLKGSREEVVRNTDKRLHQLQETTIIQINNDIGILNKKCSTLTAK